MSQAPNPYEAPKTASHAVVAKPVGGGFFGHPWGLLVLFIVEMWERFSYYGMRAMLILYLTSAAGPLNPGRGWSKLDASSLYGWYTGLAYLLPILGGIIADRWIGNNRSLIVGGVIIAIGHIVLGISGLGEWDRNEVGMALFIAGLVLIVIGTGHFKPCVSSMVGQLYEDKDPRRDGAFTIFYMGINLGAMIGPVLCGILGERFGWHWGFGAAAVGMILGLIVYQLTRGEYLGRIGMPVREPAAFLNWCWIPLSIAIAAVFGLLFYAGVFGAINAKISEWRDLYPSLTLGFSAGLLLLGLAAAAIFTAVQDPVDRGPVASIFILMVLNAFFWLAFEQAGSSINLYTEEYVDRKLALFDWEVPASTFQSVNPFFILVFGPLMSWLWTVLGRRNANPSQGMKLAIGLALLGAGFLVLVFASTGLTPGGVKVGMSALILCYFLHTIGELCISPTGLSYVTKTAPLRFVSLLMGIWFISNFTANLVGALIAGRVDAIASGKVQLPWNFGGQADFFMLFVVTSGVAAVVALILTPLLKKLARK